MQVCSLGRVWGLIIGGEIRTSKDSSLHFYFILFYFKMENVQNCLKWQKLLTENFPKEKGGDFFFSFGAVPYYLTGKRNSKIPIMFMGVRNTRFFNFLLCYICYNFRYIENKE
jgi:hypothetical protein